MTVAPAVAPALALARPVTTLGGVGRERAALLARLEIHTVEDLLLHAPRRYEDRQHLVKIADLELGRPSICYGTVVALGVKWFAHHTKSIFDLILEDGGARLHCRWWNTPYLDKYFARGDQVLVFGRTINLKPRTIDHPETEILEGAEENFVHLNRLTPIYPLTEGLPQRWLRSLIWRTLEGFEQHIQEPYSDSLLAEAESGSSEHPAGGNSRFPQCKLPSRARAIRMLHFPEAVEQIDLARRRLALDEFVELQMRIRLRRQRFHQKAKALRCEGDNRLLKPFLAGLGFRLTVAQTQVLREIRQDMSGRYPMRRLLQGDVGSGKTVVAACCALMCAESGYNSVLMAPTEILAEQHFLTFHKWFRDLGVKVELRTGSRDSDSGVAREGSLTIGTHALLNPGFRPERLGLVVIDEQHKFGVAQREELVRKGDYPHLLAMTATPIPRTLALTLYGELDVSTINGLPPGRGRIRTFVRLAGSLPQVWEFIRSQLQQRRQAYVIYPRVEETTGPDEVRAVKKEFKKIAQQVAPFSAGLLYGSMSAADKESVMSAFRSGNCHVLVATSVIEVGMDVPNATVMLIENAECFGLSQLHQMRGRIGRGAHDSYCILVSGTDTPECLRRLSELERTNDGFEIAEADLKIRGPGELLGHGQSGIPSFRFGDLARDLPLIRHAREIAMRLPAVPQSPGRSDLLQAMKTDK